MLHHLYMVGGRKESMTNGDAHYWAFGGANNHLQCLMKKFPGL
jgi:hypothetical protein